VNLFATEAAKVTLVNFEVVIELPDAGSFFVFVEIFQEKVLIGWG
jgi:hypothetical protein